MGMFDWIPCCGPRRKDDGDNASTTESATLIHPQREGSILSTTDAGMGYGSMGNETVVQGGMTGEQRARIEEIGRQVGNSMLPIHNTSTSTRSPHLRQPQDPAPGSSSSSRPSSPSPIRPGSTPPGRVMSPEHEQRDASGSPVKVRDTDATGDNVERVKRAGEGEGVRGKADEVEVVQKRLFVGGTGGGGEQNGNGGGNGGGGGRGRGGKKNRGRGRGRGRGKK